jgi:toxin-antitoxin system PIN domain toxin
MISPDVQLLVYAYDELSKFHVQARNYWSDTLSTNGPVGIPIQSLHGFLRIVTHPSLGPSKMPMEQALLIVSEWLDLPQVRLLVPGERHWSTLHDAITASRASGGFVSDVAIAATVMEYGAVLHTADHGFARIPGLRWLNPLSPPERKRAK